jgi:hypothetical protein
VTQATKLDGYLRSSVDEHDADNDDAAAVDITVEQFNPTDLALPALDYDVILQTTQVISLGVDVIKITYLHVTTNEVTSTSH